jgi:hypothetical protein
LNEGIYLTIDATAPFVLVRQVHDDFRDGVSLACPERTLVEQHHIGYGVVQAGTDFGW